MTRRRSLQMTVTNTLPALLAGVARLYLRPIVILSVAFYAHLSGEARACPALNGQSGMASWYGPGMGKRTASGEKFDMWAMTAAHPCLPMGTKILVTVLGTRRSLIVTVNDRLPSHRRILDLSVGAARALGIASQGLAFVRLTPISSNLLLAAR
jgi:rare lipoprotein A (peptidoglycan hydrolase)